MKVEGWISGRLFAERNVGRRVSRTAVVIAVCGVAVGVMVMVLSVCIVLGFKGEIREKVVGFGGHIEVVNYGSLYSAEAVPIGLSSGVLDSLSCERGVCRVERFCIKPGMLKTVDAFKGVVLRGVGADYDGRFLSSNLVEGRVPVFSDSVSSNEIVLSRSVCNELGLLLGDRVYAYFFSDQVKARRFRIVGIYETHLREFDGGVVFTDLYTVQRLNGWQVDEYAGAELFLDDFGSVDDVTSRLIGVYNHSTDKYGREYSVHAISELYPGLFTWLDLIDTNVYVILSLMLLLSLFTMVSGLLIIILERRNFIAVMKSMGATNGQIRGVFLNFALRLVVRGIGFGLLLGLGLALFQKLFGVVSLDAETYYIDRVPIAFSWRLLLLLVVVSFVVSVLTLLLPTHLVSRIHPAKVMRYE